MQKLQAFGTVFFLQLPNFVAATVFILLAWLIAHWAGIAIKRLAVRRNRPDLGSLLASLGKGLVVGAALFFAAAIVFPSVNTADILATLGFGSIAVGFAFKDILQNMLAGLLLLIQRPYRAGDQIIVKEFEGTVERIESRATLIKTYDGRRVIIPNSDIFTSPVIVNTAFEHRRNELLIGIGYGDNPAEAMRIFQQAIQSVEGILTEPAPEILPWALNDSTVDLKARWWASAFRTDQTYIRSQVVLVLYEAAKNNGIDLPFPTSVMLFHDQTEDTDGDRSRQREGWPTGSNPPRPRPISGQSAPQPAQTA